MLHDCLTPSSVGYSFEQQHQVSASGQKCGIWKSLCCMSSDRSIGHAIQAMALTYENKKALLLRIIVLSFTFYTFMLECISTPRNIVILYFQSKYVKIYFGAACLRKGNYSRISICTESPKEGREGKSFPSEHSHILLK